MRNYLLLLFFFCIQYSLGQENKHTLSFEFGYGVNTYSMKSLNDYYIDSFASQINSKLLENKIKSGQNFNFSIKYNPTGLFDLGLYGSYQNGNSESSPLIFETDQFGNVISEHQGNYKFTTEALSTCISSTWYINHLLNFQHKENKFLNKFHFGIELNGGVGFSKATADMRVQSLPMASFYEYFNSVDFHGQIGLKVEYDFVNNPFICGIGLKGGYQFFRTKTLKDRFENDWIVLGKYPINLDFSGLYFGAYFRIGK